MNEMQNKIFDILSVCVRICERLDLRYYLVCGSALGAVKYQGFIPWDDDIDVGLLREDYEVFLREAPALLPENIFLQNYRTDPAFPHVFSKLRNSDTTWIEAGVAHLPMNHGMYIDVFPLDGYPQSWFGKRFFELRKKTIQWKVFCALKGYENWKMRVRNRALCALGYHKRTAQMLAKLEKLYCKYPPDLSEKWCNHGNWQGKLEYAHRSQYGMGKAAVFEGLPIIIPENYDEYLTQKYGDWRSDPPDGKCKSHHNIVVCDLNHSYREYIGKKS